MNSTARGLFGLVLLCFLNIATLAAPAGAPVIRVDGEVPASSPVTRGEQASISMTTPFSNGSMFFTLDGSAPSASSTRYTAPFTITTTTTIRAVAYSVDFTQIAEADPLEVRIVPWVTLSIEALGGTVSAEPPPTNGRYLQGTVVRLTAHPSEGWQFVGWAGDSATVREPIDVILDRPKTIRAIFGSPINLAPAAHGSIDANPPVTGWFVAPHYNLTFRITPVPDPGYYLVTWGGVLSGSATPATYVHTTPNPSISALFEPLPPGKVTLTATSNFGGTVDVFDNRQNGGPKNLYDEGSVLSAIARPSPGWMFLGWSGDVSGLDNPVTVTLDRPKRLHATFAEGRSLTVNASDGGTVTRNPEALIYSSGTVVRLTAVPAPGFTFAEWSGAATGAENPTSVTVNGNVTVNARFVAAAWEPLWSYAAAGNLVAVGNIVYGGALVSLTADGELRWFNQLMQPGGYFRMSAGPAAIDPPGRVRIATSIADPASPDDYSSRLVTFDSSGQNAAPAMELGRTYVGALAVSRAGDIHMVQTLQGRLGLAGHRLDARTSSGAAKWTFSTLAWQGGFGNDMVWESFRRPAIALDEKIYFGGSWSTNSVYALASDGTELWRRRIEYGNITQAGVTAPGPGVIDYNSERFAVPPDVILGSESVYVVEGDGSLLALDFQGNIRWRFTSGDVLAVPSIGADGTLYVGARNSSRFYAINADGSLRWVRNPGLPPYSTPAIGADGTIYVAADRSLIALRPDGMKFKEFVADSPVRAPVIEGDRLYISTSTHLYAFAAPGGFANSPWPMRDAVPQKTGTVRAVAAPPEIAQTTMTAEGFRLTVNARPGATVKIYRSENLSEWTLAHTETTATGQVTYTHSPATSGNQFFVVSQE